MTPEEAAERLAADPAAGGLFLDFDGTLTPIVDDPRTSRLETATRHLLRRLAGKLALVAVVSGRPADFLSERAAAPGVHLLGLYGLETARNGEVHPRPELAAWEAPVERAKERLRAELEGRDGLYIEDKGRTVAVHWRHAPDREAAELLVDVVTAGVAEATGLTVVPGKFVAELRPPVDWDKGTAVAATADEHGVRTVVYAGDDLGDLAAFEAVEARGGIKIGVDHGAETPLALRAAADVLLDGAEGVRAWLEDLDGRLG